MKLHYKVTSLPQETSLVEGILHHYKFNNKANRFSNGWLFIIKVKFLLRKSEVGILPVKFEIK